MNHKTLRSHNPETVRAYVRKKFEIFNTWHYREVTRRKKCMEYWIAASVENKSIVEGVYFATFKKVFPKLEAQQLEEAMALKAQGPVKISRGEKMDQLRDKLEDARFVLRTLETWKEEQRYQEGEGFFLEMKSLIAKLDPTLCDPRELMTEVELKRVAMLTGKTSKSAKEVAATFDAMIGIEQNAKVEFNSYSGTWGSIDAALTENFKLGAWGKGEASAKLTRLGISLEAQVALAIGMELNIDGKCSWQKGDVGLDLEGNANVFLGAKANFAGKLSVSALKGLEASIEAGAFAGFKASVSGSVSFKYGDEPLIKAAATADFIFGVSAELKAKIKAPIFGATEISFGADVALGLGGGVSVETEINFSQIYLAGRTEFAKVVYLPTLMKGYKMDLMKQDAKNLHYLNKCIIRIGNQVESLGERIISEESIPSEKQSLLMYMDD